MLDVDKWQEILSAMRQNILRTVLTALGIFWAMLMFMVLHGVGNGLENGIAQGFQGFATNSCYVWARGTTIPYKGFEKNRWFSLTNDDTEYLKKHVTGIDLVCPRNPLGGYRGGNNVSYKTKSGNFQVMGDVPEIQYVRRRQMTQGRFLNQNDITGFRKVCTIGIEVKNILFGEDSEPIGEYIKINGVFFKVVGIFKKIGTANVGDDDEEIVHIPNTTFQRAFNRGNLVDWYAITAKEGVLVSEVESEVLSILADRHSVSPDDDAAFGHYNAEESIQKVTGLTSAINFIVILVGAGTLLAGVIGISNIMLIVVKERTKEIGIKRALGATPWAIINQIVSESIILTLLAGFVGIALGIGIIELVSFVLAQSGDDGMMFLNPNVSYKTAIMSLVILICSGVLAGLIPANRALSIKPVEALRDE